MNLIWKSWKRRTPTASDGVDSDGIDWESRYTQLARTYAALQVARDNLKQELIESRAETLALHMSEAELMLWIVNVCVDLPLLKVRIDRCEAAYARLTKLVAEAQEKGWILKEEKS